MVDTEQKVIVIGAGLAGCEAALQLAKRGIAVDLYEMRPHKTTGAHSTQNLAEFVCSNSLGSFDVTNASGLLKKEMEILGSFLIKIAHEVALPAGNALAIDRVLFSQKVEELINQTGKINIIREEIKTIPQGVPVILASGPLTSDDLAEDIKKFTGSEHLHFFDAIAPIVEKDSIDFDKAFYASRYDKGEASYINCPMNKEEYETFYNELVNAESAELHSFDKKKGVYEGCMPIEVMASRGADTMRFGPLKPVGLRDPRTGHRPWAVLQLRREDASGTMYNLVGFQTNLKFGEQKRVFSLIPALKNAEFIRYGVMHRNTFIDSPRLLNSDFSFRGRKGLYFAGQITGVEGYMESAAAGILAGLNMARYLKGEEPIKLPEITMLGALSNYISNETVENFQPMGANFGIIPPLDELIRDKKLRYEALAQRSLDFYKKLLSEERRGEDEE